MLKPSDVVALADLPQRQISAAIKIAAAIITRKSAVSEAEIRSLVKMDDLAWTHAKTALSKHFVFTRGRISFPSDAEPIDPWDVITPSELDAIQKRIEKEKSKKPVAPLTPIQQTLHSLGGMTERQAVGFYHAQAHIYGHAAVVNAITVAAAAKPGEPKAYIIAILRRAAQNATVVVEPAGAKRFPQKVLRYKKPVNPEASKTEFLGWEAPDAESPTGTTWPAGVRRKLYRLNTGELAYETPLETDVIPTVEADPGCIVIS